MWSFRWACELHLYLHSRQFRYSLPCTVSTCSSRCCTDMNFRPQKPQGSVGTGGWTMCVCVSFLDIEFLSHNWHSELQFGHVAWLLASCSSTLTIWTPQLVWLSPREKVCVDLSETEPELVDWVGQLLLMFMIGEGWGELAQDSSFAVITLRASLSSEFEVCWLWLFLPPIWLAAAANCSSSAMMRLFLMSRLSVSLLIWDSCWIIVLLHESAGIPFQDLSH